MSNKDNRILRNSGLMFHLGHENYLRSERVVAIVEASSLPMKRMREKAQQDGMLVDTTAGRRTKALVLADSGHVFLSALSPHTLQERFQGGEPVADIPYHLEEGDFVS